MYQYKILFYWVGSDRRRRLRSGLMWAYTHEGVYDRLRKATLVPLCVSVSWYMVISPLWWWQKLQSFEQNQQLSAEQVSLFFRVFAHLLQRGIAPYNALLVFAQYSSDHRLHTAVRAVIIGIERGLLLGDAFAEAGAWWPRSVVVALTAAQSSGKLDRVSVYLSQTYLQQQQVKSEMITVLIVPVCTASAAVVVLGWVAQLCVIEGAGRVGWVLPLFIAASKFVASYGLYVLIGLLVGVQSVRRFVKPSAYITRLIGQCMLNIPVWGPIIAAGHSIFFFMIVGVLLRAGVSVPEGLAAIAVVHPSNYWRGVLHSMVERLHEGWSLYDVMSAAPRVCIPDDFVHTVSTVTSAEHLAGVCEITADLLQYKRSLRLQRSIALLQPVLMISIGSLVGYFISVLYESLSQSIHSMHGM